LGRTGAPDLRENFLQADFSVEMGGDDPVLEVPWTAADGSLRYCDLRTHPELIEQIEEARRFPELGEFLRSINAASGGFATVKCDAWASTEIEAAEEIFGASHKIESYCDVILRDQEDQCSFAQHERMVQRLVALLKKAPEIPAAIEFVVRQCLFHGVGETRDGCAITCFAFGYGHDEAQARRQWAIALKLVENALGQAARKINRDEVPRS
jgi:hypothetical protein